jgi:pectate lyase
MTNSTTGNKQLYLVTRYVDAGNWYGAGLNVQSSTASTQVEIAKMLAGSLSRPKPGASPDRDGRPVLHGALRNDRQHAHRLPRRRGSSARSPIPVSPQRGLVGLYTANKSFQIDDVRVGDPRQKPVQLTLDPVHASPTRPKPAMRRCRWRHRRHRRRHADSFSAASSKPGRWRGHPAGTVTVTPLSAGTASVVFSAVRCQRSRAPSPHHRAAVRAADPGLSAAGRQPARPRTERRSTSTPPEAQLRQAADARRGGSIRIFRKADDALVDVIRLSGESDALGYPGQALVRRSTPRRSRISGNTATIKPHSGKLAYGTEYYVAISDGVFTGARWGLPFAGIGKLGGWSFTTRAAPRRRPRSRWTTTATPTSIPCRAR